MRVIVFAVVVIWPILWYYEEKCDVRGRQLDQNRRAIFCRRRFHRSVVAVVSSTMVSCVVETSSPEVPRKAVGRARHSFGSQTSAL
jgi:hypothetical protein